MSYETQQALEAAKLAETDVIRLMNSDTKYISACRICDDMFETTDRRETCCDDCRLPNGQKIETIDDVPGIISSSRVPTFHAETGSADNSDLVICEMCGQTFSTYNDEDYCPHCRNNN